VTFVALKWYFLTLCCPDFAQWCPSLAAEHELTPWKYSQEVWRFVLHDSCVRIGRRKVSMAKMMNSQKVMVRHAGLEEPVPHSDAGASRTC